MRWLICCALLTAFVACGETTSEEPIRAPGGATAAKAEDVTSRPTPDGPDEANEPATRPIVRYYTISEA